MVLVWPEAELFRALLFGAAFAGFLAAAYRLATEESPGFELLQSGDWRALAHVPLVVLAAPFIIMRNTLRGRRFERRSLVMVWAATVIAGLWGMASGKVMLDLLALLQR